MSRSTTSFTGTPAAAPNPPPQALLCGLALFAAEIVYCARPVNTISSAATTNALQQLLLQQQIMAAQTQPTAKRDTISWCRAKPQVHVFQTAPECIDCVATLMRRGRAFAVAIRMRYGHGKWRAEEISVL